MVLAGEAWVEEIGEDITELKVHVRHPAVEHGVRTKEFRRWLESYGKNPSEVLLKQRLSAIIRGGGSEG